ncbi:Protein SDA1-like [Porphyridium purpureum]|uniref:Protein SDA1 n=1 Tax=Porphyridium purpureum TaxID=35688 RepID=A0A5J4YU63_PORPP|nr:Protein SDA1-like [Porphyridium purpureum]|eukprot:POR4146..scf227_4
MIVLLLSSGRAVTRRCGGGKRRFGSETREETVKVPVHEARETEGGEGCGSEGAMSDAADLQLLLSRCRKDPASYVPEYVQQKRQFDALIAALELRPSDASARLGELAGFMASVGTAYKDHSAQVAATLIRVLGLHAKVMDYELRRQLVRALAVLRSKGAAPIVQVVQLFFGMLNIADKQLRKTLHGHIIADLRNINKKHANEQVNRKLQGFLYERLQEPDEQLVKRSLHVLTELFRTHVWRDARTANVIASACFHENASVFLIAGRFLLDSERHLHEDGANDSDVTSDEEDYHENGANPRKTNKGVKFNSNHGETARVMWETFHRTSKKSSRRKKRLERQLARMDRVKSGHSGNDAQSKSPFSAMMLLNDPQSFAERLFSDVQNRRKNEKYEVRLVALDLITRLTGIHELFLLNLYPYFQRFLQPHQRDITKLLAYLATSVHDLVPPDVLHPLIRTIADNFIADRCMEEMIAAGLNAVRAICARAPLAIEIENAESLEDKGALLQDLVAFRTHRDKGVAMAARSLMQVYRDVKPGLLAKKDRGKDAQLRQMRGLTTELRYGQRNMVDTVEGADLLQDSESDLEDGSNSEEDTKDVPAKIDVEPLDSEGSGQEDEEEGEESDDEEESSDDSKDGEDLSEAEGDELDAEAIARSENGTEDSSSEASDVEDEEDVPDETDPALDRKARALQMLTTRVLDDEDYAIIARRRAEMASNAGTLLRKRGIDDRPVSTSEIESYQKKQRRTLEERLVSVHAGREDREKFGSKKGRKDKGGGTTNKVKQKQKDAMMLMNKQKHRRKMSSLHDKQKNAKRRGGKSRR